MPHLFDPFLQDKGIVILDGALATELENRGADLNHPLWSAKLLTENPALIKQVHADYLLAGADIITSASYQASFTGFAKQGYPAEEAIALMQLSISLAVSAKSEFLQKQLIKGPTPLVAASVGPYGASLADGSEYRGNYGLSINELIAFHKPRIEVLANSGADLLACETIPCPEEAIALIEILKSFPGLCAWISFSCKDASHVSNGVDFASCVSLANKSEQVIAVGLNCTAPNFVEALIVSGRQATDKEIIVYPNKGDTWDALHKCWLPGSVQPDFTNEAKRWQRAGATIIGGCCRTSPEDIRQLRSSLLFKK